MSDSLKHVYTIADKVGAFAVVIILSAIGGVFITMFGGFTFPKCKPFNGYQLKPLFKRFSIPPLLGMIIMGCIARNLFGPITAAFPDSWANTIRNICLCILLLRGGLAVTFANKGLLVLLLVAIPQTVEASVAAGLSMAFFDMPVKVAYCLGYVLACVSATVVIQQCMPLYEKGFGKKKDIPTTMMAGSTFDDITCIVILGIIQTITYIEINAGDKSESSGL